MGQLATDPETTHDPFRGYANHSALYHSQSGRHFDNSGFEEGGSNAYCSCRGIYLDRGGRVWCRSCRSGSAVVYWTVTMEVFVVVGVVGVVKVGLGN